MKGWMKIGNDPTAVMAADIYCPIIKRLSRNKLFEYTADKLRTNVT